MLVTKVILALLFAAGNLPSTFGADLSIAYSQSPGDQALNVAFFNRQTVGNALVGTLQIQNISGTWVYIEQDLTSSPNPVAMPYAIYLLGPDATKTFQNFTFPQGSYLKLTATTPVGLDFTQPSEKLTALEGAFAVDLIARGLLTFSLPGDAFDQPPVGEVIEPLLDTIVSTVSPIGEVAIAIKDRSLTEAAQAVLDIAADSKDVEGDLATLLNNYVTADQVHSALGWLGELLDLPEKATLLTDLTSMTFQAPPVSWSRMDVVAGTQAASISSVSPATLTTMPVPQTQPLTIHGAGFTSSSSLIFTIGSVTYASRPERLHPIDANTMQYDIAVGSAVGTWTVTVAEGTGSATFQVVPDSSSLYTITPSAGPHGSITPDSPLTKAGGESQQFTAAPQDSTFTVDSWYVDGTLIINAGNRFTLPDIQAPHTVFVTFKPISSPSQTGSLTVTLLPEGAISAGAQWQVDGGNYRNNGDTVTGLTPGAHTISCKAIPGYTPPPSHTVTVAVGAVTSDTETYSAVSATTYSLTLTQGGSMGYISPFPSGTWNGSAYVYTAGSVVQLTATADPGYHFVSWGGDASGAGAATQTTITMNANMTVSANFASGDPNMGTVTVTIMPPEAAVAGVTWGFNANDYRASGSSCTTWPATYILSLHSVDGWLGPSTAVGTITAGQTTAITVTFTADTTPGFLTVTLSPPDAVTAGAKWHANGGAAQGNGASLSLSPGSYSVTFDAVSGWAKPSDQDVEVQRAQTTVVAGNYTPPAGQPLILSISPAVGALIGGTLLTIDGVNFTALATVLIGGQPASNVAVASSTQITCLTPPSTNYGSTNVIVQTTGGSATNANGFAYGTARGSRLDLVSAFGGSCFAVAVQGNHAYVGEGRNLLVLDVSAPLSPSKVGQITLPGPVMKIDFLGNYAYVAAMEGGLQVVDISTPSTPTVRGFYLSTNLNYAAGVTIYGGRAYVADQNVDTGLEILDLNHPTAPALLSSIPLGGSAQAVVLKASASGTFAYVTTGSSLHVVDVSQPTAPVLRGSAGIGSSVYSIVLSGNYVFGVDAGSLGQLHMVDVSNPDAPLDLNTTAGGYSQGDYTAVAVQNSYLFAESSLQGIGLVVFNISGTNLVKIAQNPSLHTDGAQYDKMITSAVPPGNQLYVANGASGLQIIDVSNPYSPSAAAPFNDGGLYGSYTSVAVTGNTLCAVDQTDLKVFDVGQAARPVLRQTLQGNGGFQVLAQNGTAYVWGGQINIYDVTTPSSPHWSYTISYNVVDASVNTWPMALDGNMLYVGGGHMAGMAGAPRFVAVDVSNPSSPVVRGTKDYTAGWGNCAAAAGDLAVMGIGSPNELSILDVSDPTAPTERASLTLPEMPYAVAISPDQSCAYVIDFAAPPSVLRIADIHDPSSPSIVTNVPLDSSSGQDVKLRGGELCAATWSGVYVFDAGAPASPALTRWYSMSNVRGTCLPGDSAGQSGYIYVADGDGGVVVLQEQDIQPPEVFITTPWSLPICTNVTSSVNLGGGSDDNVGVTAMTWVNNRGGSGQVSPPFDNWYVTGIPLCPGTNVLTVAAFDAAGNSGSDTLTVI